MSADLSNFFLASPMPRDEFMKVKYKYFPEDIRKLYGLENKKTEDGYIYIRIKKGMYGLKQAALLAYEQLKQHLEPHGYVPVIGTVGLWTHKTKKLNFCLCVDDFGIKYLWKEDADHLLNCLGERYKYTTDWDGKNYCGLNLDWNYHNEYVDISMNGYARKSLKRLQHQPKVFPQFSPHRCAPIQYGQRQQQAATKQDDTPFLTKKDTTHIQSTAGTFLYYARAIDSTILPALNEISGSQSQPTAYTQEETQQLMDYLHTHPNAFVRYYASDMILHVDSDAAYLVLPKARSRIAGYYYLSSHPNITKHAKLNGAILVECKTLRHVVSSAAEAEVAGVYYNATQAIVIRRALEALGHLQPPTPIKTDNSTATGFVYDNIHQKRSKSWDMRYYWLRDKMNQRLFNIYWDKGSNNHADYFTKHHATTYHRATRNKYIHDKLNMMRQCLVSHHTNLLNTLSDVRGCVATS